MRGNHTPPWSSAMSARLLYHALGIRGYQYVATDLRAGAVVFRIDQALATCRCPACGSAAVQPRGRVEREFRAVPIGRTPVVVRLPIPRVGCRDCGAIRQVAIGFAEPRRSSTRAFARYVLDLGRLMTVQDVARHLGVSWDLVKEIIGADLRRRFGRPKLNGLK